MRFAVYGALWLAFIGQWVLVRVAPCLQPKTAAWTVAAGAVVCALVWLLALSALTVVTLGRLAPVAEFGHWSARSLRADSPVPVVVGALAAGLLVVSTVRAARLTRGIVRSFAQLRQLRAATWKPGNDWCVIVDSAVAEAVTVPGWPGSVVVTSGMLDALEPHEHPVLLAHERCHLQSRHWLFQLATRLAAAVIPVGGGVVVAGDQALERWADEHAASEVGDRTLVARTVAKAALAASARQAPGFGTGMADGAVVARVEALMEPHPRTHPLWLGLTICGLVVAVLAGAEAVGDAGALLQLARYALG